MLAVLNISTITTKDLMQVTSAEDFSIMHVELSPKLVFSKSWLQFKVSHYVSFPFFHFFSFSLKYEY